MQNSAGILIYKYTKRTVVVLIVHSSGQEELEPWSIPKGEFDARTESSQSAALREIYEELGIKIEPDELIFLGESVYRNKKKRIHCFAWKINKSIKFKIDSWETKHMRFVPIDRAREMLHEGQSVFIDRLVHHINFTN